MNASVIKIRLFITSKLCSTSIKYKYIGLIIGIHISPFAYSYCIKGAFISPLIHYIANNDTNLNNATTNENTNAASNKNLIMIIYPCFQCHRNRVPFRLIAQPLTVLMPLLVPKYPVLIYRLFGLNTAYRWYYVELL